MTNMDKLYEAVEARGPVCVGQIGRASCRERV